MFSLFRMESYRFIRTKSVYVVSLILIAITVLGVVATTKMNDNVDENAGNVSVEVQSVDEDTKENDYSLIDTSGVEEKAAGNKETLNICKMFTEDIASAANFMLWGIIISIYMYAEYKNGFVKSIAGQIPRKGMLSASKLHIMALYTVSMFVIEFVTFAVTTVICGTGYNVKLGFTPKYMLVWIAVFILYMAVTSIFIFIMSAIRISACGVAVSMIIGFGMTSLIYKLINWLLYKIGINSFDISKYMPDAIVGSMSIHSTAESIIRALIVGGVFTIIFIYASIIVQNRKDI